MALPRDVCKNPLHMFPPGKTRASRHPFFESNSCKCFENNRLSLAIKFAHEYDVVLVLKGADTIVATPDKQAYISTIANSGMATAGSGDVLAGIIAGFLAQGMRAQDAATCGVYVHSAAGNIARDMYGERSMTATNIIENISKVLLKY